MPTAQERHALAFLTGLALLAVGVRALGVQRFDAHVAAANAGQAPPASLAERALAAQAAAVDSAARAPRRGRGASRRDTTRRSSRGARAPKLPTASAPPPPPAPVNVNTATAEELERLPRVGPALARRIVEWRERHGPFSAADDLRHVRGIGPSTVRQLDTLVTFSGRHSPLDGEGPPSPAYHSSSAF
ncbi:ComEA family DNA-binding protein [Gemmatimonas sp.]|uniref:ComEA family DNA-binding protein n=1 Tax=Gemmatimonas sp. TaxID=1962908 RepID=UPI0022C84C57|nr:ComEA family DNA-binding protein [Gemmatimonas sp.]MCZ8206241.1 ComEA family DNA-binding protein [Gemmatimonas sp.]